MKKEISPNHVKVQAAEHTGLDTTVAPTPRKVASGAVMGRFIPPLPTPRKVVSGAAMGLISDFGPRLSRSVR